ncbi:RHS repeat-associated core domain-containing protein [Schumannella sp. 10F1B-5-1]|uniref:RHS repeat-associated core domain-containing protein n=1 Tax=Schumannella sp. 10F1B-5-1 TaxID=2590780 RepID=UPI0015E8303B|nr:RHS repeat-associated core domain-containing protein [Schumannella sp. 10F1B-5-1]
MARNSTTGYLEFEATSAASGYRTVDGDGFCYDGGTCTLILEGRTLGGAVRELDQWAISPQASNTAHSFAGAVDVEKIDAVRTLVYGPWGANKAGDWVSVEDEMPGSNVSVAGSHLSRDPITGYLTFEADVSIFGHQLPGSVCANGSSCGVSLSAVLADGEEKFLAWHDDIRSTPPSYPRQHHFTGTTASRKVVGLVARVQGAGTTLESATYSVQDPYVSPAVSLAGISAVRTDQGYVDVQGTMEYSGYRDPGAVCEQTTQCEVAVVAQRDDGTQLAIASSPIPTNGAPQYPQTFSFHGIVPSIHVTSITGLVRSPGRELSSPGYAIEDLYPIPKVAVTAVSATSDGTRTLVETDVSASFYNLPDAVCRNAFLFGCNLRVIGKTADGGETTVGYLETREFFPNGSEPAFPTTVSLRAIVDSSAITSVRAEITSAYGTLGSPSIPVRTVRSDTFAGGGNPSERGCQCSQADPVNTLTGEFYLPALDLDLPGAGPAVALPRTYTVSSAGRAGSFGHGWASVLDARVEVLQSGATPNAPPQLVKVVQENGSASYFNFEGGVYAAGPRSIAKLERTGPGTWILTRNHRDIFRFDETGALSSHSDRSGNTVTYHRDPSGRATSIEGSAGRTIDLTWSGSRIIEAQDSAGRTVTYVYSGSDLTTVTGVDGSTWAYGYDTQHRMITLTRPGGGMTTNAYDGSDRVTSQIDPIGRRTSFAYAASSTTTGHPDGSFTVERYSNAVIASITEAFGTPLQRTSTFTYDDSGNLLAATDPLGRKTSSTYDVGGNELTSTDPLGRTTTRTFDSEGNTLTVTDPLGHVTSYEYGTNSALIKSTTPGGRELTWTHNDDGTVRESIDAGGGVTRFTYTPAGQVKCVTDPSDRTSCSVYDAAGRPITRTAPDASTSTQTFDPAGRIVTSTDANAHTTTNTYDAAGNLATVTTPSGRQTTFTYDAAGQRLSSTDAAGTTTYSYNAAGQIAATSDPLGRTATYGYDVLGRGIFSTDPLGRVSTRTFDAADAILGTTSPSGATTGATYDAAGEQLTSTDPLGKVTTFAYDAAGRQISATDPLGRTTTTTYSVDDEVTAVTAPGGSAEQWTYTLLGQVASYTNADGRVTTYSYDPSGMLTGKTEPGGRTSTVTYDSAARIHQLTRPDSTTVSYAYDPTGQLTALDYAGTASDVSYTYDADGARSSMTDRTGTTTYAYDTVGRTSAVTDGSGDTISYGYDAASRRTSLTYPGSKTVTYGYDLAGQMTTVTDWNDHTTQITRNLDGLSTAQARPNGVADTTSYDLAGQPLTITSSTTTATLASYGYTYDDAGQLSSATRSDPLTAGAATPYTYDGRGQLSGNGGANMLQTTAAGSITAASDGSTLNYGSAEQLLQLTQSNTGGVTEFSYDANGARIAQAQTGTGTPATATYGWSQSGSLDHFTTSSGAVDYASDGDGLRQTRTESGATEHFLWDTAAGLPLLLDDGDHWYIYGTGVTPLAQVDRATGETEYLHADALGSVRTITDEAGAAVGAASFDDHGNRTGTSGVASAFGFTGNWTDAVTGLIYLRARDYDPATMQFLRVDPAVDTTHQPYAYASNNPLQNTDHTGLDFWNDFGQNALAFGAGFLDDTTGGLSSIILGAVVPGYDCFVADHQGAFTAGQIASTVVSVAMIAIPGVGLAAAGLRMAAKVGVKAVAKTVVAAAKRTVTTAASGVRNAAITARSGLSSAARTTLSRGGGTDVVPYSPEFASRQLLSQGGSGFAVTPGGRSVSAHAADRIVSGAAGRPATNLSRVDEILDSPTRIRYIADRPKDGEIRASIRVYQGREWVAVNATTLPPHIASVMVVR